MIAAMTDLRFHVTWASAGVGEPEVQATAAQLGIFVGDISLTRSEDIWSQTVRDNVFVSAYPLAMWFATSWWRMNYEPLPPPGKQPSHDWRMAHELAAANHGYVWPSVVMACDGEAMQIWAAPAMKLNQSIQYLQGLPNPQPVAMNRFQRSVGDFIKVVLNRLDAKELGQSDLASLWAIIQEDLGNTESTRRRKLEAQLGYDPEECPLPVLEAALAWECRVGGNALAELAPAIVQSGGASDLNEISHLANADGLVGEPQVHSKDISHLSIGLPWERAVHAARSLRRRIANDAEPISDEQLCGLLGLTDVQVSGWRVERSRAPIAVAMPLDKNRLKFIPRKRSDQGKRFELARFLAEYLRPSVGNDSWLASTDLSTSRQKYQRAFAAELLCPIDALGGFLDGDFSAPAIDDAAERFNVSEQVVRASLANNGYLPPNAWASNMPYRLST